MWFHNQNPTMIRIWDAISAAQPIFLILAGNLS
jgi:hypothetical protein